MIREIYSEYFSERINDIITPEIINIKSGAENGGIYQEPEWKNKVSEKYLYELKEKNLVYNACQESNLYDFPASMSHRILEVLKEIYPDKALYCGGHFYYPPTGYMGWHTNYAVTDDRVYVTYSSESNKSFFRYLENGKVVTDYDDEGLTFRRFSLSNKEPYFWHCVGSECDRFSFGFRLLDINDRDRYSEPMPLNHSIALIMQQFM